MRYDIAIVGSGPAGLSAAVNAKIRNKKIILFGNENLSNKLQKAPEINNYLGFYEISGEELKDKFKNHVDSMGIEITNHKITNIYAMGDYFALISGENMFEATTVILATGIQYGKPIKGEEEYLGRGVGYCATCDAPLYRDKRVAIIGYNKEAEEEANFLNEIASKTYFIPMYKREGLMRSNHLDNNIEVINEVEMAYRLLPESVTLIGITGTNGKTTTTTLTYKIMKEAYGDRVHLAGNIGYPLCSILDKLNSDECKKIFKLLDKIKKNTSICITSSNLDNILYFDNVLILGDKTIKIKGAPKEVLQQDNELAKLGFIIPQMIDLSLKLNFYGVLDEIITDVDGMVDKLWK